jgi:hypothetical protein
VVNSATLKTVHTGKKSTRRGISGQRLRLLRLKWERVLLQHGCHEGVSNAQLARRLKYGSRSSVSKLEKQTFVKEDVAVLFMDALAAELVYQFRGIEVDFDPADWGLPVGPLKPPPTAYRDRPRDARPLAPTWLVGTSRSGGARTRLSRHAPRIVRGCPDRNPA